MRQIATVIGFVLSLMAPYKVWSIEDSKGVEVSNFYFGTIGKIPIGVELTKRGNEISGKYFYHGRDGEIDLQGKTLPDGGVEITENSKGKTSGLWKGVFSKPSEISGKLDDPEQRSLIGTWREPSKPGASSSKELKFEIVRIDIERCATCAKYPNTAAGLKETRFRKEVGPILSMGNLKYQMITESWGKTQHKYPVFISVPASLDMKKINRKLSGDKGPGLKELDPFCTDNDESSVTLPAPGVLRVYSTYSSACGAHPVDSSALDLVDLETGTAINFENIFRNGKEDLAPLLHKYVRKFEKEHYVDEITPEELKEKGCFDDEGMKNTASLSSITPDGVELSFWVGFPECLTNVLIPMNEAVKYASKNSVLHRLSIVSRK